MNFETISARFESQYIDWVGDAPDALRQAYDADRQRLAEDIAPDCRIESVEFPSASGLVFIPREPKSDRAIVYFHGGGWVVGAPETHRVPCSHLAVQSGLPVYSMRYRLAPEHPFPAQREDGVAATTAVLGRVARIVLAGDSAGAAVAFWTEAAMPADLRARVDGMLGLYGVYGRIPGDADGDGPLSNREMRSYYERLGRLEALQETHGFDIVTCADEHGPPCRFVVGDIDPVIGESLALAEQLRRKGRTVVCDIRPGLGHGFAHFVGKIPVAEQTLAAAAWWSRDVTS